MRQTDIAIRQTSPDDLEAIATIYAHHVQTGVATFELTPPDPPELQRRMQAITADGLPFSPQQWTAGSSDMPIARRGKRDRPTATP